MGFLKGITVGRNDAEYSRLPTVIIVMDGDQPKLVVDENGETRQWNNCDAALRWVNSNLGGEFRPTIIDLDTWEMDSL